MSLIKDIVDERIAAEQKDYVLRVMLSWKREIDEMKRVVNHREGELQKRVDRYEKYSAMSLEQAYNDLVDQYGIDLKNNMRFD